MICIVFSFYSYKEIENPLSGAEAVAHLIEYLHSIHRVDPQHLIKQGVVTPWCSSSAREVAIQGSGVYGYP